ncbi:MAG: hypothetical protein OZSIB_0497 [Candidatus Ozemobacter sibiricus]|uniref:Uncharacterized protein n=1 Tax=Candidatus Ozemobacter sibiricus TaxID=2268124 RepID=A0A367ZLG9_9BACT|nr:MAG: hypothetical protein OZSIB_0497 [Candidatus Ozemobacter sibiricus]
MTRAAWAGPRSRWRRGERRHGLPWLVLAFPSRPTSTLET